MTSGATVTINCADNRFEMMTEGKLSILEYVPLDDQTLALTHTEVPAELEGHGLASKLVEGVFEYLDRENMKIVPQCAFVVTYLKRHPDWNRLVTSTYE